MVRNSVDWQDDAINAAPEERATVADLRLWLNDQNVCLHLRGQDARDHVTIPLCSLAEGLALDWWTLFGARDHALSLIQYRSGFAVPDIRLTFDGAAFEIAAEQRIYTNPDVRFWAGSSEVMTRSDAEDQLSTFIEIVLDRLRSRGVTSSTAALRWARVKASREDPDEASFCEAAGALRLDPYQIDEAAAQAIEQGAELFEGEALTEFLAGAGPANAPRLIEWATAVERRPRGQSVIEGLQQHAAAIAAATPEPVGEESWARGYRRARALRRDMGFDQTRRFSSFVQLSRAMGATAHFADAPAAYGIHLLRSHAGDEAHLHMRPHGKSEEARASQMFAFARGVGDVICFPAPQRAPVNGLRSAFRQAAGRAFAAEFLAPVTEIMSMQHDGRDIIAIAEEFAVSTLVIERQIENAARIEVASRS